MRETHSKGKYEKININTVTSGKHAWWDNFEQNSSIVIFEKIVW